MAIKNLIVRGRVGFDSGDVKYIFTHGLAISEPPDAEPGIIVYSRASSATTNQAKMSGVSQGSARSSGAAQSYSR